LACTTCGSGALMDLVPVVAPGLEGRRAGRRAAPWIISAGASTPFNADAFVADLRAHGSDPAPVASRYGAARSGRRSTCRTREATSSN